MAGLDGSVLSLGGVGYGVLDEICRWDWRDRLAVWIVLFGVDEEGGGMLGGLFEGTWCGWAHEKEIGGGDGGGRRERRVEERGRKENSVGVKEGRDCKVVAVGGMGLVTCQEKVWLTVERIEESGTRGCCDAVQRQERQAC